MRVTKSAGKSLETPDSSLLDVLSVKLLGAHKVSEVKFTPATAVMMNLNGPVTFEGKKTLFMRSSRARSTIGVKCPAQSDAGECFNLHASQVLYC